MGVVKNIPIREAKQIEFRAELFNALNNVNFLPPEGQQVCVHVPSMRLPVGSRTPTQRAATQTRTFNYRATPGAYLLSATNPENGTVNYTYNSDSTLATKTDAKGQQVQYSYDSYKRVNQIRRYPVTGGAEDPAQRTSFYYDSNPFDGGAYSHYTAGRLAAVQYGYWNGVYEWYSYTQAGSRTSKRVQNQPGSAE